MVQITIGKTTFYVELFGYATNRYVELDYDYNKYYFHVYDDFVLSDIKNFSFDYRDYPYCEKVDNIRLDTARASFRGQRNEMPFPVGDYSYLDDFIEIALELDINVPIIDNESCYDDEIQYAKPDTLKKIIPQIKEKISENVRLLKILNAESIMNLAKTIDKQNLTQSIIEGKLNLLENQAVDTNNQLTEAQKEIKTQAAQIAELKATIAKFESEKAALKSSILFTLTAAISKI